MFDIIQNRKKTHDFLNLDNFFGEFFKDSLLPNSDGKMFRLDIKETETGYSFIVECPGIRKEDIDLSINEDILTISVVKNEEIVSENTTFIRKERKYGNYSRSFAIPNIQTDQIKALYENGILTLTLPKAVPQQEVKKSITIE